jgi:hypothetical protein
MSTVLNTADNVREWLVDGGIEAFKEAGSARSLNVLDVTVDEDGGDALIDVSMDGDEPKVAGPIRVVLPVGAWLLVTSIMDRIAAEASRTG